MSQTLKAFLLLLFILSCGCIRTINPQKVHFNHSPVELETLKLDCRNIESEGTIFEIMAGIKRSQKKIIELIGRPDPTQEEVIVRDLAESIRRAGEKISTLIKAEWTDSKWNQKATWVIDEKIFKYALGNYLPNGLELKKASIHSVYLMGEETDYLKNKISIKNEGGKIIVSANHSGSSLEICQLQETLLILVEVQVRNLNLIKKKFIGLTIYNGAVGIYE